MLCCRVWPCWLTRRSWINYCNTARWEQPCHDRLGKVQHVKVSQQFNCLGLWTFPHDFWVPGGNPELPPRVSVTWWKLSCSTRITLDSGPLCCICPSWELKTMHQLRYKTLGHMSSHPISPRGFDGWDRQWCKEMSPHCLIIVRRSSGRSFQHLTGGWSETTGDDGDDDAARYSSQGAQNHITIAHW